MTADGAVADSETVWEIWVSDALYDAMGQIAVRCHVDAHRDLQDEGLAERRRALAVPLVSQWLVRRGVDS